MSSSSSPSSSSGGGGRSYSGGSGASFWAILRARLHPSSQTSTASDSSPPTVQTNSPTAPPAPAAQRQSSAAGAFSFHVPQNPANAVIASFPSPPAPSAAGNSFSFHVPQSAANAVIASFPSSSAPSAAGNGGGGYSSSAVLAAAAPQAGGIPAVGQNSSWNPASFSVRMGQQQQAGWSASSSGATVAPTSGNFGGGMPGLSGPSAPVVATRSFASFLSAPSPTAAMDVVQPVFGQMGTGYGAPVAPAASVAAVAPASAARPGMFSMGVSDNDPQATPMGSTSQVSTTNAAAGVGVVASTSGNSGGGMPGLSGPSAPVVATRSFASFLSSSPPTPAMAGMAVVQPVFGQMGAGYGAPVAPAASVSAVAPASAARPGMFSMGVSDNDPQATPMGSTSQVSTTTATAGVGVGPRQQHSWQPNHHQQPTPAQVSLLGAKRQNPEWVRQRKKAKLRQQIAQELPRAEARTLAANWYKQQVPLVSQGSPTVKEFVVGQVLGPVTMEVDRGLTFDEQITKDGDDVWAWVVGRFAGRTDKSLLFSIFPEFNAGRNNAGFLHNRFVPAMERILGQSMPWELDDEL